MKRGSSRTAGQKRRNTRTSARNTKQAVISSIMALVLCCAMLIGTTMAWFTDSVSSGKNKIVAGNLDVELEYAIEFNETTGEPTKWETVTEETKLFSDVEADGTTKNLWEPGHTEVVYLRVRNTGTLALKYQFAVNVTSETPGTNVNKDTFNLSDYLVFGEKESDTAIAQYAGREDVWAALDSTKKFSEYTKEDVLYPEGTAEKSSEKYVVLAVYMPETVGNEANYRGNKVPQIEFGVTLVATQTPYENDSFGNDYDKNVGYPVATINEFKEVLEKGGNVVLTKDITLTKTIIQKDTIIDLNGHTLKGSPTSNKDVLIVKDATVTVKNGTLEAPAVSKAAASAVYAEGKANVTIENCTLKTSSNQAFTVSTNGDKSKDSVIVIKNSTISAPNVAGKKGYAAYIPAGTVTFENCDVTGHIFISGGNVTLNGGTYTATGFNTQSKIWNKADTVSYVAGITGGSAYTMGDSIFIADRRDGYALSGLTIRNITFNTEIKLKDGSLATAYAIKYVDMGQNGAASRVPYVIENNTFNQQIDGADPVMFIDLAGNDITN